MAKLDQIQDENSLTYDWMSSGISEIALDMAKMEICRELPYKMFLLTLSEYWL